MNEECLKGILTLLNQWWTTEDILEETLRARVVLIFKKGDSGLYENYRPISLLNSLYDIHSNNSKKNLKHIRQILTNNTIWFQKRQKHSRRNTNHKKSSRTWTTNKKQTTHGTTRLGKSI